MNDKRIPTVDDIKAITAQLSQHPNVTKVTIVPVLSILVEIDNDAIRREVYEVESEVIDKFPGFLFDFHTTKP